MQRMLAYECIPLLVASGKNGKTTSGQTRRGLIREKPFTFPFFILALFPSWPYS